MRGLPALAFVALALAPRAAPATGAPPCAVFDRLDAAAATSPDAAPEGATCTRYLASGGAPGLACHWSYPYRAPEAAARAGALWQALAGCRPGAAGGEDAAVNHPDSYALRLWKAGAVRYALSLKDKAAQGRTLVFLRREGPAGAAP